MFIVSIVFVHSCRPKGDNVDVKALGGDDADSGKYLVPMMSYDARAHL